MHHIYSWYGRNGNSLPFPPVCLLRLSTVHPGSLAVQDVIAWQDWDVGESVPQGTIGREILDVVA